MEEKAIKDFIDCYNELMGQVLDAAKNGNQPIVRELLERAVERTAHCYDLDEFEGYADKKMWSEVLTFLLSECESEKNKDTPLSSLAFIFDQNKSVFEFITEVELLQILYPYYEEGGREKLKDILFSYMAMARAIDLVHARIRPIHEYQDIHLTHKDDSVPMDETNNDDRNSCSTNDNTSTKTNPQSLEKQSRVSYTNEQFEKFSYDSESDVFVRRDLKLSQVSTLFDSLIKEKCIQSDTDFNEFAYRITGKCIPNFMPQNKIRWMKSISTLTLFVHLLVHDMQTNKWKCTINCFKDKNGEALKEETLKSTFSRLSKKIKMDVDNNIVDTFGDMDLKQICLMFDNI